MRHARRKARRQMPRGHGLYERASAYRCGDLQTNVRRRLGSSKRRTNHCPKLRNRRRAQAAWRAPLPRLPLKAMPSDRREARGMRMALVGACIPASVAVSGWASGVTEWWSLGRL